MNLLTNEQVLKNVMELIEGRRLSRPGHILEMEKYLGE